MKITKLLLVALLFFAAIFTLQRLAVDRNVNGLFAYLPYVAFFVIAAYFIGNIQKVARWIGFCLLSVILLPSCEFIGADKIGVRVENFGKSPDDFKLVYGKFPVDVSASSWNLEYPGQSFGIPVDGFNVFCKDGVSLWCDPSVLCELVRTDEACRKYAFKFFSYQSTASFQAAIHQVVLKETLDAVRAIIGGSISDSIVFNRGVFESSIQLQLQKTMLDKYGINLSQFSLTLAPPESLQKAINDRLLAQEEAKKTIASLENAKAKLQLAEIDRQRMDIEGRGLSPQILRKMEIEYNFNAWYHLSQSPNKVFISGNPSNFMITGN